MDYYYDTIISNISKLIILDVSYSSDYNYNQITVAVRRYLACLRAMFENW